MTLRLLWLAALVVSAGACSLPIEGAACDCIEGNTCCVATNECIAGRTSCVEDRACDGVDAPVCHVNSHCVDRPSGGVCVCNEGHLGARCSECAAGYFKMDERCVPVPTEPTCRNGAGCAGCVTLAFCDAPGEEHGTWCERDAACSHDEAVEACVYKAYLSCGFVNDLHVESQ